MRVSLPKKCLKTRDRRSDLSCNAEDPITGAICSKPLLHTLHHEDNDGSTVITWRDQVIIEIPPTVVIE